MRSHAKASTAGSTQRQANGSGHSFRGALATRVSSAGTQGNSASSTGTARRARIGLLSLTASILVLATGAAFALAAVPPVVSNTAASLVVDTTAVLEGEVNPNGEGASYRFEFVTAAEFEESGYANASVVPTGIAGIGNGVDAVVVFEPLEGLTPETEYRFRLVATNPSGATFGPTVAFSTFAPFPPEPDFGPCPNDALRVGFGEDLPDCRAYEQVTPIDKNGNSAWGQPNHVRAAPDGSAYMYMSSVPFPPGKGPQYVASRDGATWSSHWAGAGLFGGPFGITEDLMLSVGSKNSPGAPGQPNGVIGTVDGSFEAMPLTASTEFVGASADNSKIFLQSSSGGSFDVWDRDTQTLTNVGVLPDSACGMPPCLPPTGAIGGSYHWWPHGTTAQHLQTGGVLQKYYAQDQHVISRDGSAYFTTRGNGQVYLRKDSAGPSPETLHVSASEKTNGGAPDGRDAAGAQPAAFMGATPDGSVAFFTSPEMLTNDANTGPEATYVPPAIGRANLDGEPASVDLDFLPASASAVEVNGTHIYWVDPVANAIGRANLDGTGADPDFIRANNPRGVAVDGSFIYWTNVNSALVDGQGTIGRAKLDGTEVKQDFITGASNPQGIAVNATHIYWANVGAVAATRKLGRAKIDGTEVNQALTLDGTTATGTAADLALSATHVFWLRTTSVIARANLDGTSPANSYVSGVSSPQGIASNATHLFWANFGADAIGSAKIGASAGEEVKQAFIASAGKPQGIASNATHLFWSNNQEAKLNPGNDLYRFDAETGELVDIAPDDDLNGADVEGVLGYSDDGETVYFAANGDLDGPEGPAQAGNCAVSEFSEFGSTGECSIYVVDEGEVRFIARVDAQGTQSTNWIPSETVTSGKRARVSTDGGALLFNSVDQLTDYDNQGVTQFYRYSLAEEEIVCVSCNPTGAPPFSAPGPKSIELAFTAGGAAMVEILTRNLSADGGRVLFESSDKLVADDTNGDDGCPLLKTANGQFSSCQDIYMWEAEGSGSCDVATAEGGCIYLISNGKSPEPVFFGDASVSGDDIFFYTFEQLVRQDEDEHVDVYDARVGGGIAAQNAEPPLPCEGEACRPGTSAAPPSETAGTANFAGSGNAKGRQPKPRCPKGKRKVRRGGKTRCVRKAKRAQRKSHKRAAKTTRRASR